MRIKKTLISVLIILTFILNGTIINSESFTDDLVEGIETNGGSTIILEEYTATWCQTCAEIDPDVKELVSMHDERVALIALHPADGVDDLGNYASSKRINYLFNNSLMIQSPTFLLDGDIVMKGANEINMLNSKIMQTQSKKSNFTKINLSVKKVNNSIEFEMELDSKLSGIVNIMIIENKLVSENYVGELNRFDNVLVEMISIDLDNYNLISGTEEWSFVITNSTNNKINIFAKYNIDGKMNVENIGFLASHEVQNDNMTSVLGAVKIIQGENINESNLLFIPIFLIVFSLGIFASLGKLDQNQIIEEEQ
ncbi:MAG: hypothetical protein CL983_00920 [Euryarchaeota archaeon]|nr:hypothetical protein [Euryarchaeota archaeon]